jgi:hypothetical protein
LTQDGTSRGVAVHACRLDVTVEPRPGAPAASASALVDLGTDALAWFAPGAMIDVLCDPSDPHHVVPMIEATRQRATSLSVLPPAHCRGLPDQVYLKEEEREIANGVTGEAIVGCLDIATSERSVRHQTTIGLWVLSDGTDAAAETAEPGYPAGYHVKVSEPLLVVQLLEIPVGATIPVTIDPANPKKVVIDYRGARIRLLDQHSPNRERFAAAASGLGRAARITAVDMTGSKNGVRYGCSLTLEALDPGGDEPIGSATLSVTVPDLVLLLPGSFVIVSPDAPRDAGSWMVDLDATAETRALATRP